MLSKDMVETIYNEVDVCIFAKDRHGRYIYGNDSLAKAAGLDSKEQIEGKTDYDLIWRGQAELFRTGDARTLSGSPHVKIKEFQKQPDGVKEIITSKNLLLSRAGEILGICGSFYEHRKLARESTCYFNTEKRFIELGIHTPPVRLSFKEARIYYYLLCGFSSSHIAKRVFVSRSTVLFHIANLKQKLQCSHQGELIEKAITTGLAYLLFDMFHACPSLQ